MGKAKLEAFIYSRALVIVFGILGNILVIVSMVRQKKTLLKSNHYLLVLHLAICDLAALILYTYDTSELYWFEEPLAVNLRTISCNIFVMNVTFQFAGVGMMLIISLLRFRATVHPLKPAVIRRKLKIVCGLMYLVGLIAACATLLPSCFIKSSLVLDACEKFYFAFAIMFGCYGPTIFMAVVYYKVARALMKQNQHMKRVCSSAPVLSFNILRSIRNRRAFLVCLSTVLCYGIAHTPLTVWLLWFMTAGEDQVQMKYGWVGYLPDVLKIAGSHSVNPLIYGILDKKLLAFAKFCRKKKRRTPEN